MFVRCPFCHKLMLRWFYEAHARKHTRKKPDGQQNDHVTTAPGERYRGSLDGVPRTYRHARCGGGTGMPEEIIRSYLVNPLLYIDRSFCCRCGDYIDCAELTWVETGENMMTYNGRLRAKYLERVLGISRARQRAEAVIVTPAGAEAVHQSARQRGFTAPYFFVLEWAPAKWKGGYFCCVAGADACNPRTRVVLESSGVQILVPQAQVERLRGTIVDYKSGPRKGFQMCRLYVPQQGRPS